MKLKGFFVAVCLLVVGFVAAAQSVDGESDVRKGYHGMLSFGTLFTDSEVSKNDVALEVLTAHGYRFCPYIFAGVGLGVEFYSSRNELAAPDGHIGFLPVFADFRGYLLPGNKVSPFVDAKVGYRFALDQGRNSLYFSPELGFRLKLRGETGIYLSGAYTLKNSRDDSIIVETGGFSLKIGLEY